MDKMMMVWVSQHRTPFMDWLLEIITWAGSLYLLLPLSLLLAVCLNAWGKKDVVWLLALGFGGAVLFAYLLKLGIRRPRPDLFPPIIPVPADFSFPSAHTTQIAAFCLCLVICMVRYGSTALTWLTSLISLVLVCGVGYSRIYLHVHFPSDVVAGLLLSTFWVTGVAFFLHRP